MAMPAPDVGHQVVWNEGECSNSDETVTIEYKVPNRYQNLSYIGHGAFGSVMRATDTQTKKVVAIKKMKHPFDSDVYGKRTYRELRLLMHLNHEDAGVVQLYNVFTPDANAVNFNDLYLVMNFAGTVVPRYIRQRRAFTEDDIKLIVYSVLRALKFIHAARIIHRDVKPENIAISENFDVTLLDFGLSRVESEGPKTGYVATRWWRAPEVLTNWGRYDEKVDIWSVGCVMAELILLRPLFPGTDTIDQLDKIVKVIGTPDPPTLDNMIDQAARDYIMGLPKSSGKDFKRLFPALSEDGIDLLKKLLQFDHRTRPTAEEALAHPFLAKFHDTEEEPSAQPIEDPHNDATYSVQQWKTLTWELMQSFQEPRWALENINRHPQRSP